MGDCCSSEVIAELRAERAEALNALAILVGNDWKECVKDAEQERLKNIVERMYMIANDLEGGSLPDEYADDCREAADKIRHLEQHVKDIEAARAASEANYDTLVNSATCYKCTNLRKQLKEMELHYPSPERWQEVQALNAAYREKIKHLTKQIAENANG